MRTYVSVPSDELAYEKLFATVNRSEAELEERIEDYIESEDSIEQIIACDYEYVFGMLKAIYSAGENKNYDGMTVYARSLHRFIKDTAESIVRSQS